MNRLGFPQKSWTPLIRALKQSIFQDTKHLQSPWPPVKEAQQDGTLLISRQGFTGLPSQGYRTRCLLLSAA